MKASNKQHLTRRNTLPSKKKQKSSSEKLATVLAILVLGIGVIVVIAALLTSVASFFNDKKTEERTVVVQKEMSVYLEQKYKESFTVAEPERNGQMLGDPERWKAEAYPLHDSNLRFIVNVTHDGDSGSKFSDDYAPAIWTKEQHAAINQKAREIYGDTSPIDVSADISISGIKLSDATATTLLSYDQAIRKYPDEVNYKITIVSKGVNPSDIRGDIEKAHDIAMWVRAQGARRIWFDYTAQANNGQGKRCLTNTIPDELSDSFINACFASKGDYAE